MLRFLLCASMNVQSNLLFSTENAFREELVPEQRVSGCQWFMVTLTVKGLFREMK